MNRTNQGSQPRWLWILLTDSTPGLIHRGGPESPRTFLEVPLIEEDTYQQLAIQGVRQPT